MNTKQRLNKKGGPIVLIILSIFLTISSCKKKPTPVPDAERGTVADAEGNVYGTIKIGNQWWMTENLKAKKYQDGTSIKLISNAVDWQQDTTGSYCEHTNDAAPGLLYNWYAISNSKSIAPKGWRIPSDEDWKELEKAMGMSAHEANKTSWRGSKEGDKLKIENSDQNMFWQPYGEIWATNESGFKAMAGGYRMFDGGWGESSPKTKAFFWSSSIQNGQVWYRYLDYQRSQIFRYHGPKAYGFSVRCIKN
jgi:uncharacterized protein (TIGR02145 family)